MSTIKRLIEYTEDERKGVLQDFNRTPETIKVDIDSIRSWYNSQPHLPQLPFSDKRIESFLILNKMSVEKTKQKIDMYFTARRLVSEFYFNKAPYNPKMRIMAKAVYVIPLRKLSKELYRPILYKFTQTPAEMFDPIFAFAHVLNLMELQLDHDCCLGTIPIIDFQNITVGHATKITPTFLKRVIHLTVRIFSNRTNGIHILNCSSSLDTLISLFKSLLKEKIRNRVHIHKDVTTLYEFIPKSDLPKDYGGEEISTDELHELWYKALEEYRHWFMSLQEAKVNERLRPGAPINDEILGFHGNFRKLEID